MANRFRVEAWSLPLATTAKIVHSVPFIKGHGEDSLNGSGRGLLTVRTDWERIDDIDPAFFRVYQDGVLRGDLSFFGRRHASGLEDPASSVTEISGPKVADIPNWARVENFDYPIRPTVDPDWQWGGDRSVNGAGNMSFEESELPGEPPIPDSTDFEDQTLQGWESIPGGGDFRSLETAPVVNDGDAQAGTYSLVFNPATRHSGIRKKITVQGGETYELTAFIKSVTTGKRFTFGIEFPAGAVANHTNAFVYNGIAMAELGNVPSTGTGLPGGSTDGTWQSANLDITMPTFDNEDNSRDLFIYVQYDHHDASDGPIVRIDSMTVTGPAAGPAPFLGLDPWKPWFKSPTTTVFEQDPTPGATTPDDGSFAIAVDASVTGFGFFQRIDDLTVGRTVTFTMKVHQNTGSDKTIDIEIRRASGGGLLSFTSTVISTGGGWTTIATTALLDVPNVTIAVRMTVGTGKFFADTGSFNFGMQPASWGDILQQLLDDAAVDHTGETPPFDRDTLGFLDYTSFTAALDSAGNAWSPAVIDYRAKRGKKYKQILTDGERFGFEWRVRDTATGLELDIFNPYDWTTRTGGVGTSRPGTGVPTIRYGNGVTSGPVVKQSATMNRVHIEGDVGLWDVRRDPTAIAAFDTREGYEGDTNILDDDSIGALADQLLDERTIPTTAIKVNIDPQDDADVPLPYRDFVVGDTYPLDLAGKFTGNKRVVRITTDFTTGHGVYTVEFDQTSYTSDPQKAVVEGVRRLLEKFDELDKLPDNSVGGTVTIGPVTGVIPTFLVAASTARQAVKDIADYVCDGVADEVEIQIALDLADTLTGGRVVLSAGTFNISDLGQIIVPDFCALTGLGWLVTSITYLNPPVAGTVIEYGSSSRVGQFSIKDRTAGGS